MEVVISCGTNTEDSTGLAWDLSNGSVLSVFKPNACAPNCLTYMSVPCPVSQSTTTTIANSTIAHYSTSQQGLPFHNNTPAEEVTAAAAATTKASSSSSSTAAASAKAPTATTSKGIQGRTHKRHEIGSSHTALASSFYLPHTFTIAGAQSIPLKASRAAKAGAKQGGSSSYAPTKIIQFWNWRKEQPVLRCPTSEAITSLLAVPSQPPMLAAGTASGTMLLWNTLSGALVATWEAHIKRVTALAAAPDGGLLVTASDDATVAVWSVPAVVAAQSASVRTVAPLRLWSLHSLGVTGVAVCGGAGCGGGCGGRVRVVSASLDHTVRVWDVNSGECAATYTMPSFVACVACDPCGRFCAVGCGNSKVYRINLLKFANPVALSTAAGGAGASSLDGAGAGREEEEKGEEERGEGGHDQLAYEGHSRPVTAVAVNGNGARIVSASLDGAVIVWDTLSRQPVLRFTSHNGPVNCVVIAPLPETIAEPNAAVLPLVPLKKVLSQNPAAPVPLSVSQAFASNPANAKKRSRDEEAADAKTLSGVPVYVLPEVQFGIDEIWGSCGCGCEEEEEASVEGALDAMVDEAVKSEAEIERAKVEGAKVDSVKTLEKMLAEARTSEARWKAAANSLYQLSLKQAMGDDNK